MMYSPLNEEFMFQEMRTAPTRSVGRAARTSPHAPDAAGGAGARTVRDDDRCADGPEQDRRASSAVT